MRVTGGLRQQHDQGLALGAYSVKKECVGADERLSRSYADRDRVGRGLAAEEGEIYPPLR